MTEAKNTQTIEEIERLFRPSGALLAAESNLGRAIECFAVAKTEHGSALLDLLVRLRFAPDGQLRGVDLVRQLHMSPGYVSRLIDQAESEDLVSRHTDPNDRRAHLIMLTPAGEQAFDDFVPPILQVLDDTVYAALSADEIETFVGFLERISERSRDLLGNPIPSD